MCVSMLSLSCLQLLVSGVVVRSSAYEMLKKGEIALLGVVTHINGSTVDGFNAKLETPHCLVVQYDSKISVGCSKTFLEGRYTCCIGL